jgi:hypothetical protein
MLIFFYFHCIVLLKIKFGLIKKEGIWIFTMKQYIYIYIKHIGSNIIKLLDFSWEDESYDAKTKIKINIYKKLYIYFLSLCLSLFYYVSTDIRTWIPSNLSRHACCLTSYTSINFSQQKQRIWRTPLI